MKTNPSQQTKATIDLNHIEQYRKSYELPHHWQLRKEFLRTYSDRFDLDRLICLSHVFVYVECMELTYPDDVMKLIKELGTRVRGLEYYKHQLEKDEPEPPRKRSLLQWLVTFELDGRASIELRDDAYYNLADGYVCARILNQISPQYFSDKWLDGIKPVPPNGSWRLRVSNLKRILQKIHDYASDLQNPQFRPSAINPDVAVIAQNFDPDQISRLIQLILFCAINCDKKEHYIERIRNLPIQVKQDIKEAIEELLIKDNDNYSHGETVNSENSTDLTATSTQRDRLNTTANSSYNINSSPGHNSSYRNVLRRNSSQLSGDISRRSESHLDISSHDAQDIANETIEEVKQRLNAALIVQDKKSQACHELEIKLKQLQLEKEQLTYENERLIADNNSSKLSSTPMKQTDPQRRQSQDRGRNFDIGIDTRDKEDRFKNLEDENSQNLILQQNRKLQNELNRLKEDVIKVETEKEDYRLKSNLLKDDLDKITLKHDELRNRAEQAKRLQDELDEQKHLIEKISNYETTIENLMKRNSEMKKELKSIEEKNVSHIHKIVSLEEENNQLNSNINRAEIYKKQLHEAQVKLSEETHRADKAEVELSRLSEKFSSVKKENERLYETTNQLIRGGSNVALKNIQASDINYDRNRDHSDINKTLLEQGQDFEAAARQASGDAPSSLATSVIELKERIARLEYENELLQKKLVAKRESDQSVLGGLLDSANARCTKLEVENRQSRKRILLLESRLKDQLSSQNGASTSGAVINDSSSDNTLALINRVEELQRLLFQKEQELMESESKYKKNLQKAKDLIKTLHSNQPAGGSLHPSYMSSSSFNSSSLDETNLLKQQLKEREDRLIELEREFYEFKKFKEIHERLIVSAFYGLTTPMQWKNAEKRLQRTSLTSPPNTASSSMNHSKHSH